jgi:hypothetical protein
MPSLGFLVILLMWLLAAGAPSILLARRAVVRNTRLSLLVLLISCGVLAAMGWASFTDPETPDFESAAVKLMGVWALLLYGGAVLFGLFYLLIGWLGKSRSEA